MESISNGALFEMRRLIDGCLDRARQKESFEPTYVHDLEREVEWLKSEVIRLKELLFKK